MQKSAGAAYLGPVGTFTQQAAAVLVTGAELMPKPDIDGVFESLASGGCAVGVLPLENSSEGAVNATLDGLLRVEGVYITAVLQLPIRHAFMGSARPGKILAHPQALAQCRGYIRREHPDAELVPCASNGEAAYKVSQAGEEWAAVGPLAAAKEYGLRVIAEGIQDSEHNSTAFIRLERAPSEGSRTSVAFSAGNKPGALYRMLGIFEAHGVNMTKILSRPIPELPGEYVFFTDVEGGHLAEALLQIEKEARLYKYLGSYERMTAE